MDDGHTLLTIGQVARRTGMPVRTIRYWSDLGVVSVAGRSQGGYRLYDAQALARLELVATLRQLGLSLDRDPGIEGHLRQAPDLPEDPTPEQVDAWVELAELVQDPDFRRRVRQMAEYGAQARARGGLLDYGTPEQTMQFVNRASEQAGAALQQGIAPESAEGAQVLERILAGTAQSERRSELLERRRPVPTRAWSATGSWWA